MKRFFYFCVLFALAIGVLTACKAKKETPVEEPAAVAEQEVYQPKHQSQTIDLSSVKTYEYVSAPTSQVATSVAVSYNKQAPYKEPVVIKYLYSNGDSYTYTIPSNFGLWCNEVGRIRVIIDKENTVWLQGQTKKGKFHEFIFYGNPKFNGKKIKPNSYLNLPDGLIEYR